MWKDYSSGYIKNNRASGISIMAAAFIAALFLSFLCSLFYNIWVYEVEKLTLDEGEMCIRDSRKAGVSYYISVHCHSEKN